MKALKTGIRYDILQETNNFQSIKREKCKLFPEALAVLKIYWVN
jgi:hypothetical protein